jgi:hypothetical protein
MDNDVRNWRGVSCHVIATGLQWACLRIWANRAAISRDLVIGSSVWLTLIVGIQLKRTLPR